MFALDRALLLIRDLLCDDQLHRFPVTARFLEKLPDLVTSVCVDNVLYECARTRGAPARSIIYIHRLLANLQGAIFLRRELPCDP